MSKAIVVFDGDCGLCNGFVAFLVRRDRSDRLLFAGSAGRVGSQIADAAGLDRALLDSTIVLWRDGHALTRTDAVAGILALLPRPWSWLRWLRLAPRPIRDRAYAAIAARRPRGTAEDPACGMPPKALADRWRAKLATASDVVAAGTTREARRASAIPTREKETPPA